MRPLLAVLATAVACIGPAAAMGWHAPWWGLTTVGAVIGVIVGQWPRKQQDDYLTGRLVGLDSDGDAYCLTCGHYPAYLTCGCGCCEPYKRAKDRIDQGMDP